MKNSFKSLFFIVSILILFIISCDLEKLDGYEYTYDPPPESAIFTGTIYNRFTFEPVELAQINIANQITYSDAQGKYILYYHYNEDEERNQPVDIKISRDNYLDVDTSIVVFPENELNVFIKYAAPIIQRIALVDTFYYLQAIVSDYQGYNDITTVHAQYAYRRPGEKLPSLYVERLLTRVFVDSLNTSYYQSRVDRSIPEYGNLMMDEYSFRAEDRNHLQDFMTSMQGGTNLFIFPPNLR